MDKELSKSLKKKICLNVYLNLKISVKYGRGKRNVGICVNMLFFFAVGHGMRLN